MANGRALEPQAVVIPGQDRRKWLRCRLATLLLAAGARPLVAQRYVPASPPDQAGLELGLNLATLTETPDVTTTSRTGFLVGAYVVHSIGTNADLQTEVVFTQKGTRTDEATGNTKVALGYFELPMLLRYNVPVTSQDVRPYFLAGPALAYRTSCRIWVATAGSTTSERCGSSGGNAADLEPKRYDIGGVVGGGLSFRMNGHAFTMSARYEFGFTDTNKQTGPGSSTPKNRLLTYLVSIEFPTTP